MKFKVPYKRNTGRCYSNSVSEVRNSFNGFRHSIRLLYAGTKKQKCVTQSPIKVTDSPIYEGMNKQIIQKIIVEGKEIVSPNQKNPTMNAAGPFITLEKLGGRVTRNGDIWYNSVTQMMEDRKIPRLIIDILKRWNNGKVPGVISNGKVNWTTLYIVLAMRWNDIEDECIASLPEPIRAKMICPCS